MATEAELDAALARILLGTGPKGDLYVTISRQVAANVMKSAIEELIDLRHASTEFVCTVCKTMIVRPPTPQQSEFKCHVCGSQPVARAHVEMLALRAKIRSLEEQVARLTEVITTAFDLEATGT